MEDLLAEFPGAVGGERHVGVGARRGRPGESEERAELSEVLTRSDPVEELLTTVGEHPHDVDLARLDHIHQVGRIPLFEHRLAGGDRHLVGGLVRRRVVRNHVDDPIGDRHEPGVMRRHDDRTPLGPQLLQEADDRLGLDVVEVGGRFVRQQQRRVVSEAAGHRDSLLLAA